MKLVQALVRGWGVALCAALVGCGGGGGGDGATSGTGTLRVALTDAPACGFDAVNVTIEKVRLHRSANAGNDEAGWHDLPLQAPRRVNLLDLQNGVLAELGQMPLEAGRYQQLRLVLADAGSGGGVSPESGFANSVVPMGEPERRLETPSAQQSGLKLGVDLEVRADQLVDLVLDFDACKSVLRAGQSGRYSLKPVIAVIPRFISGVRGTLQATWPSGTMVSLQQSGAVVRATAPAPAGTTGFAAGEFLLSPVAPGTYDLVVAAPGRSTLVVTGVVVANQAVTVLNGAGSAFASVASDTGIASGKVTITGATEVDAVTRALQSLAGGRTIEVAGGPVDFSTGAYSHALPVGAPRVAPFAAAPATLTFSDDTAAAGRYSVQATASVGSKTVGPFAVAASAPKVNDITLP